jgi:hypothetical protein
LQTLQRKLTLKADIATKIRPISGIHRKAEVNRQVLGIPPL